jgi:hypothetical protein
MTFGESPTLTPQLRGASVTKTLTARSRMTGIPVLRTPLRAEKALQFRNKGL